MLEQIRKGLTMMGTATASPAAFFVVLLYGCAWLIFGHDLLSWHGLATFSTWMMTSLSSAPSTETDKLYKQSSTSCCTPKPQRATI